MAATFGTYTDCSKQDDTAKLLKATLTARFIEEYSCWYDVEDAVLNSPAIRMTAIQISRAVYGFNIFQLLQKKPAP